MPDMSPATRDAFLQETRIAKLAYLHGSGAPTMVPLWFEWDGSVARIFTGRTSLKAKRIAQDPRVALSVEEPVGVPERWVTIEGTATISDDGVIELIERLARRYYEPAKAEESIKSWSANPATWVVLTITPTKIRTGE